MAPFVALSMYSDYSMEIVGHDSWRDFLLHALVQPTRYFRLYWFQSCARLPNPKREKESGESCIILLYLPVVLLECSLSGSVCRVNPHYKTNKWPQTAQLCSCRVPMWYGLVYKLWTTKHDCWSKRSASKYGHAVQLHSTAFTRLFLPLWVGESGMRD